VTDILQPAKQEPGNVTLHVKTLPESAKLPKIEVYQKDWMPGFAAFLDDGSLQADAHAHIALNLASFLGSVEIGDLEAKDLPYAIAETIMHEVIHALEAWAGVEFSEGRVEELLTAYRLKYRPEAPVYRECEPRETPESQAFKSWT
jgi:hypothetical protein